MDARCKDARGTPDEGADESGPTSRAPFDCQDPTFIAHALKRSAEQNHKKRTTPYRSDMSMLVFYINRSGKNLPAEQLKVLKEAKDELRELFAKHAPK